MGSGEHRFTIIIDVKKDVRRILILHDVNLLDGINIEDDNTEPSGYIRDMEPIVIEANKLANEVIRQIEESEGKDTSRSMD